MIGGLSCPFGCFEREAYRRFNTVAHAETTFGISLAQLLRRHVGWYLEQIQGGTEDFVRGLSLRDQTGVYMLWRAQDYCPMHKKEIYEAVYVGKAGTSIETRLLRHFATKEVGRGFAVEITIWGGPNRQAKYVEQLLLDLFAFEANSAENVGGQALRVAIPPGAWN